MKRYMQYMKANKKLVEGEKIEFNGEEHIIGKMTDDEVTTMKKEGLDLLKTEVTYKGKPTPLSDIKSGKDLFNITEAIQLEGNLSGMWYVWREKRMKEMLKNISPKAQEQIKELLATQE